MWFKIVSHIDVDGNVDNLNPARILNGQYEIFSSTFILKHFHIIIIQIFLIFQFYVLQYTIISY